MKSKISKKLSLLIVLATILILSATFVRAQEVDDEGKLKGKWPFIMKCGKCHSLERPLSKRKTAEQWRDTVKTMHQKSHGWIEDKQVDDIIYFLSSKSLFETKCTGCHSDDRALDLIKNKAQWTETVKNMQKKKPGDISDDDADKIIMYLFTVQGGE